MACCWTTFAKSVFYARILNDFPADIHIASTELDCEVSLDILDSESSDDEDNGSI